MNTLDKIKIIGNVVFHESAGSYLFSEEEGKLYVALLEDVEGRYFMPKGHIQHGESPEQAAERETKEELGLEVPLTKIAKVGLVKYSFAKPGDARTHIKVRHVYVFSLKHKMKIKPLVNEDYVRAEWFEIGEAVNKLEYRKDTLLDATKLYKNHKVLISYLKEIEDNFKNKLGKNLIAIVDSGSVSSGGYIPNWSDIDLLLVAKELNLDIKLKVADVKENIKAKLDVEVGLNVISEEDFVAPSRPEIRLAGKTLQALVELSLDPKRLLYFNEKLKQPYLPNKKVIKNFSLSNIAMVTLLNRREVTSVSVKDIDNLKKLVEKQIRYALIILKLALQYFQGKVYETKADTLAYAKMYFKAYDFSEIENAFEETKHWDTVTDRKTLMKILEYADNFIESFSQYFFEKLHKES